MQEAEHGKEFCEILSSRHDMALGLEFLEALIHFTRAVQDWTDEYSVMEHGGTQEALPLPKNL